MNNSKFNSEDRLQCALKTRAVLRTLEQTNSTMTYQQLAEMIGLKAKGEPWHVRYRTQITDIFKIIEAVERQAHEESSPFHRIINADTREPGVGYYFHNTRLVDVGEEAK